MSKQKLYILITIVITLCALVSCASKAETESRLNQANTTPVPETIAKADGLFKQREDISKLREAVQLLAQIRNPDNRNYEVEWKFAKYNYFLGKQTADEIESEKAFEDGKDAGRIASRIEREKADGHFWYGANLGEQARRSPITVGLKSVDDIRETMNKVIEIQPGYQGASAYDALAQLELETRLTRGKAEKAVEYLEKGLEIEKDNASILLHLAEAYLAVKKDADARKQLTHLLQMKPNPDYLLEHSESVAKAKKMLETRF